MVKISVTKAEEKSIKKLFQKFLKKQNKDFNKSFNGDEEFENSGIIKKSDDENHFSEVKIYTSKEMATKRNGTSYLKPKSPNSNVVLTVTHTTRHKFFFLLTYRFEYILQEKYGNKYGIEHYTNWAFQIFKK